MRAEEALVLNIESSPGCEIREISKRTDAFSSSCFCCRIFRCASRDRNRGGTVTALRHNQIERFVVRDTELDNEADVICDRLTLIDAKPWSFDDIGTTSIGTEDKFQRDSRWNRES